MRKLALFAGGFSIAALVFALTDSVRCSYVVACGAVLASVACFLLRKVWLKRAAIALLGIAAGFAWSACDWQKNVVPIMTLDGEHMQISAKASDYSRETTYGYATTARISIDDGIYTAVIYGSKKMEPGDTVKGVANLRQTINSTHQGDDYYAARGVLLRISMKENEEIIPSASATLRNLPVKFSKQLQDTIKSLFPEREAGFLIALITGDTSGLSEVFYNQLSLVGIRHFVAVSGMHIAILLGAISLLFGVNRRVASFIGLPVIWFFALAVGMSASVVRAAIMQSFLLLAPLLRRENDTGTSILTALMIILIPNPHAILDVGLQLSFISVSGILLFSSHIYSGIQACAPVKSLFERLPFGKRALRAAIAQVASSLSVIPLTMPLCVFYFKLYSLITPLSSALIVSVVPICFSGCILAALLAMLWPPLGTLFAFPILWLARYCMGMTSLLSKVPFASLYANSGYMLIFLLAFYLLVSYRILSKEKCSLLLSCGCLVSLFCVCLLLESAEYDRADISVTMLNVGQGQCVYVESNGNTGLYDCGGSVGNAGETAARYLESLGRDGLDFLAVSHYDEDHAGGIVQLLARISVNQIFLPAQPDEKGMQASILEAAARAETKVLFVDSDLELRFGAGTLRLYAPVSRESSNEASIAAHWKVDTFDILLTGDMNARAEEQLLRTHELRDIELLVAGHHGSASSSSAVLLKMTAPEIVLISVGNNGYGHPSDEALARINAVGACVYRTDQCGNITVRR